MSPYESTYQRMERKRRERRRRLSLLLNITLVVGGMLFLYFLFVTISTWGLR